MDEYENSLFRRGEKDEKIINLQVIKKIGREHGIYSAREELQKL